MDKFAVHANHNMEFHTKICVQYPDHYYDWKVICLLYIAFHYLKSLSLHRRKEIGDYHREIIANIMEKGSMPLTKKARRNYMQLFYFSRVARYKGIEDFEVFNRNRKMHHEKALKSFRDFEKYIISIGTKIKMLPK